MESLMTENKLLHAQLAAAKQALAEAESNSLRADNRVAEVKAKLAQAEARLADHVALHASGSAAGKRR